MPRFSRRAQSRIASPRAPLCEENATRAGGGETGAKVAFMETPASVFTTPRQLGPTSRMPYRRATSTSARSSLRPSSPVSLKPALITISALTPFSPQARAASTTCSAGITMTARSTSPGTEVMPGYAAMDWTKEAFGLTG